MQQEALKQYYMVVDEKSTGPFSLDEITLHPALTPDTLVWKPGLDNWVAAKTLPELTPAFADQLRNPQEPPQYHSNPYQDADDNFKESYSEKDRHYNNNHSHFSNNPQYQSNHTYHNNNRYYERFDRYQNGYRPPMRTNWLPWAIVATVVGFFTSCIGAIFGIIAIVQANKANTLYAQGFDREGDAANSNARIMTIIGLIFAALGIIAAFFFSSIFTSFSNFSYL